LLGHKTNLLEFCLHDCDFSDFAHILPLLRGQRNLQTLSFASCRNGNDVLKDVLLFRDSELTASFVSNALVSPTIKKLFLKTCGVSVHNRPLMAGFHQNTTLVSLETDPKDAATRLVIEPILQRNATLERVHHLLGTTRLTTFPVDGGALPTIPPLCGLWPTNHSWR
jgi:hypothetical protein